MRKAQRYGGSTAKARIDLQRANNSYNAILERHTNNELMHQEEYERLRDMYNNASTGAERSRISNDIKALVDEREKQRAIELHELTEATEKQREAKSDYDKAKFENNMFMRTVGKVTGLETIHEIARNEGENAAKAIKDDEKAEKKANDIEKIAKLEKELREATNNLKEKQKEYAEKKGMTEEQTDKFINDSLKTVYNQSKKVNVKASFIAQAVSEYLARKDISKVTSENVDDILDGLKDVMARSNKKFDVTDELKDNVKEALEKKMVEGRKGLGLDKKDTIVTIRQAIVKGKDKLPDDYNVHEKTQELTDLRNQIRKLEDLRLQKINQINTYNEVGKIKYKSSLVSVNKIIKETSK
jgi:hypothetical protein